MKHKHIKTKDKIFNITNTSHPLNEANTSQSSYPQSQYKLRLKHCKSFTLNLNQDRQREMVKPHQTLLDHSHCI